MYPTKKIKQDYYDTFRQAPDRVTEVKAAFTQDGRWQRRIWWFYATIDTVIEHADIDGEKAFRVSVVGDIRFECYCPTLERAVQFEQVFIRLTYDLQAQFGWAECAAKGRMLPSDGETPAT